jgi:hypothetical protein
VGRDCCGGYCCCEGRVGSTGLRSPRPGRLIPPLDENPAAVAAPASGGIVPMRLGWIGGVVALRIPPVKFPELFCSSFDVRLWMLVDVRRGKFGLGVASSNWLFSWRDGLVRGDVEERCAGFFATGGAVLDLFDACEFTDGRLAGGGAGTGFRKLVGMGFGVACTVGVPVWRLGGGGGGVSSFLVVCPAAVSSMRFNLPTFTGGFPASNGGGSFLGVVLDADVERSVE